MRESSATPDSAKQLFERRARGELSDDETKHELLVRHRRLAEELNALITYAMGVGLKGSTWLVAAKGEKPRELRRGVKPTKEKGVYTMAKNAGLQAANKAKKDEFYTTYEDIQLEMNHYEDKFKGKTVLCNCDDPFESHFCKFFLKNFNYLGLKRLICTSYVTSPIVGTQMTIFDYIGEPLQKGNGYVMDISEIPMANGRGVSDDDIERLLKSKKRGVKKLKGNGDFRSAECLEYLEQADIVVTNPPFSLFREFVATLVEYGKQFLIIGNVNAITYKEIFPLIKDNRLWLGASIHSGDRKFYVPEDYPLNASGCGVDEDGRKYIRVKGVRWFTNIDYAMRHEDLDLYRHYYGCEEDYPKYDNYDAINVDKTSEIPCDYFEDIGVPITYLDKYNPEQFEIVKFRKGNDEKDLTYTIAENTINYGTVRYGTENYAILQDHHQTQEDVTELWECQSHSSISLTRTNSRLSGLTDICRTIQSTDADLQSTDEKHTQESSLSVYPRILIRRRRRDNEHTTE